MSNTILSEDTNLAIKEFDELLKRAKNGEKIKSSEVSAIANKVNDNIDSSKLITNHAILALCNLAMIPKIVKDDNFLAIAGDNFLAIAGIVNLILSVINQRIFSDKEHEK